jgi:hypothetical protein
LIKEKSKCLNCGTLINVSPSNISPMNTFSLEEEQSDSNYSRKINFSCTDIAIDKFASAFVGSVPLVASVNSKIAPIQVQQPILVSSLQASEEDGQIQEDLFQEEIVGTRVKTILEADITLNYFAKDGQEFLVSTSPDYKGKNKKTQQQRFSLLYVWAYNLIFQQPVLKDHLNQAAKNNGIHDKNYATYLGEVASKYFIKADSTFKINPGGQVEVNKIQAEIQDSGVKGFEYWNSSRKNSSRISRTTKEETQNIDDWIQKPSRFDEFDIRKISTAAEYALLALYDITKELKTQQSVKPGLAYEYLLKRYKNITVNKDKFTKALTSAKAYGKYFSRTPEGLYYLTQEAENTVEAWESQEIAKD